MQQFRLFWAASWIVIVKGWHFAEFAILLWLCLAMLNWVYGSVTHRSVLIAALLCTGFAISDEWHQTFVPDRFGTTWDVLIDCLGIWLAALVHLRCNASPADTHS